jgi:hypothetical protein
MAFPLSSARPVVFQLTALLVLVTLTGCVSAEGADEGSEGQAANGTDGPSDSPSSAPSDDTSTGEGNTDTSGEQPSSAQPLPLDESAPLVGKFQLSLQAKEGGTSVTTFTGSVGNLPQPELTIWEIVTEDEASGCSLLKPRVPSCPAGCGTGACVDDAQCADYPTRHSVGDVTIDGVQTTAGETSMTIKPQKPRFDYVKTASVTLLYPPADEGAPLLLTSAGGEYTPLRLESSGIAPIELQQEGALPLSSEEPLHLQWAAPSKGKSRIEIKVDISHHGGAKGKITCDTDDDGELDIPAVLTKGLIEFGVAGFPTVEVTRVARGVGNVEPGRVEFSVISMDDRELTVPGLTSCMSDDDCPESQVCLDTRACG